MPSPAQKRKLRIVAIIIAASMILPISAGAISVISGNSTSSDADDLPEAIPPDVVLYGDSLSAEAAVPFQFALAGSEVHAKPVPGTAICDAHQTIARDVRSTPPQVAVLQFVGNNSTSCVADDDGEPLSGEALAEAYLEDAEAVTGLLTENGVQVVWVGGPPAPGLPGEADELIDEGYRALVEEWEERAPGQVHYAPAAEAVTGSDGEYVDSLPCLEDEEQAAAESGCEDGEIRVRSDDRIHFCPETPGEMFCESYSSGARRYGEAMADAVASLL